MKKHLKMYLGLLFSVMFISTALLANPAIQKKHANMTKDGVKVNCVYCHTTAKVEKKKGQNFLKGQAKYATLKGMKSCAGADCHK